MKNSFSYRRTTLSPSFGRGFTLIETLVVIGLNTLLMVVISTSIVFLYQSNNYSFAQSNEIDAARRGLTVWVRDAREMTAAANGAYPVVKLSDNQMGFYSDIDRDSNVEYIEYTLSSTTITKRTYNPVGYPPVYSTTTPDSTEIMSEYVQNLGQGIPVFTYYDVLGVPLISPQAMLTDARYITMRVIVNIDPLRSPGEFMLRGSAAPRNLKDNL
jgi:type II secretory pathway pseudopilin PulG